LTVRGLTLLSLMALGLGLPTVAAAETTTTTGGATPLAASSGEGTGGAYFDASAPDPAKPVVAGTRAKRLPNGLAAAPAAAPQRVKRAIWAANRIIGLPYRYGGGHTRTFKDSGYDCSGTVSYALRGARLLDSPMPSGSFVAWGEAGAGRWITTYANGGHMYAVIAGLRLDTSSAGERVSSGEGPRWRSTARPQAGFTARHPAGL
jgi:hypothetical protein